MSGAIRLSEKGDLPKEEYSAERFVDRESELQVAKEKVERGRLGLPIREPLVNFWGTGGSGKTWLLRRIEEDYRYTPDVENGDSKSTFTVYHNFEKQEGVSDLTAVIQSLAQSIHKSLQEQPPLLERVPDLEQVVKTGEATVLANVILSLTEQYVPLLLLDTTEKLATSLWPELEQALLEQLLESDRVLVVISGRHRAPRWRRVEVRRRTVPAAKSRVKPFATEMLEKQLAALNLPQPEALAQRIAELTGGNPLLARHVGPQLVDLAEPDLDIPESLKSELLTILTTYQDDVIGHVQSDLLFYLDKLISLRFYRVEALRSMLPASGEKASEYGDTKLLQVLRRLEGETDVIWWDDGRNAYVTDPVLRRVMNQRLKLEDLPKFVEGHQRALGMYWQWVEKYPENSAIYLIEIMFHQATLDRLHGTLPAELTDFGRILEVGKNLDVDRRVILPAKLRQDEELKELLAPELYQALLDRLESLLG